MDLKGKTIWQHAAGDRGHDHADLCLDYDLIVSGVGPKALKEEMKRGEVVVLKTGVNRIRGVGILGDYVELGQDGAFGDLDGWRLGHARRVSWVWKGTRDDEDGKFDGRPLTRWTTQRLWVVEVRKWVAAKVAGVTTGQEPPEYAQLPRADSPVDLADVADCLFDGDFRSGSVHNVVNPDGEFMKKAKWYYQWWRQRPSENETVAHLVVPFLRSLGWPPRRIALEFQRVDVALLSDFKEPINDPSAPRRDATAMAVVEAKPVHAALLSEAAEQAKGYAKKHPAALRAIVTDGLRYGVFLRRSPDEGFQCLPDAYLNLIRPRDKYDIYECNGAKEAIWAMTPDWQPEP